MNQYYEIGTLNECKKGNDNYSAFEVKKNLLQEPLINFNYTCTCIKLAMHSSNINRMD